jgi:hypothetical protein
MIVEPGCDAPPARTAHGVAWQALSVIDEETGEQVADQRGPVPRDVIDPGTAAVFRAFFVGGRLQTMPAKRGKRLVVLDHIARVFEPGVRYPESEVNAFLRAFHPDYAMLRRYLVDEGFLARDQGVYWRTGGSVEV